MSIPNTRRFKISLSPDSAKGQLDKNGNKTQGLEVGDIVRRQYYDGTNEIYSLLCVLETGVDHVQIEKPVLDVAGNIVTFANEPSDQHWFIGELLDGSAPTSGELLDFVRITNMFDESRSGALYLTSSDSESPYLDVVDGIAKNFSLSWPEKISNASFQDPQTEYVVLGDCEASFVKAEGDRSRICNITAHANAKIKQTFVQYVKNPNEIVISFWAKASSARTITLSVGYADGTKVDGVHDIKLSTDWKYFVRRVVVDNSGRHPRAVELNLAGLANGDIFSISDFNAILLSSLANFSDGSQIRVGKLSGISDPVFGKLESYGGYFQKLFASNGAHISGTLTAGDEKGFASTFYAGKIHKNTFLNSLAPTSDAPIDTATTSPTGVGSVLIGNSLQVTAQTSDWVEKRVGEFYTFSFWLFTESACQISVNQNLQPIGLVELSETDTYSWKRCCITFQIQDANGDALRFNLASTKNIRFKFSSPQLEAGRQATQYQPTDDVLAEDCEDYGAWFSKGGIGGTIQNPLLKLSDDGSIASRASSFRINNDGSGHLGNKGIEWDVNGNVIFGPKVKLSWDNLSNDVTEGISNKSVKIVGQDSFAMMKSVDAGLMYTPDYIKLNLEEVGMPSQITARRRWYFVTDGGLVEIKNDLSKNKTELLVFPEDPYWNQVDSSLTIRVESDYMGQTYSDTKTIRKLNLDGYEVSIASSQGTTFRNGFIETELAAIVSYNGVVLPSNTVRELFDLTWRKYTLPDTTNEVDDWNTEAERHVDTIAVVLEGGATTTAYTCEITPKKTDEFPYNFPIVFMEELNPMVDAFPIIQKNNNEGFPSDFPIILQN